jgi:hypothetical protein
MPLHFESRSERLRRFLVMVLAALLAACSGGGGGLPVEITGDVTHTLKPTVREVRLIDSATKAGKANMLYLSENGSDLVIVIFPVDTRAGTYTIGKGAVGASYLHRANNDMNTFSGEAGTLTLEAVGQTFSGSFDFNGRLYANDGSSQAVKVTGAFRDVPLAP